MCKVEQLADCWNLTAVVFCVHRGGLDGIAEVGAVIVLKREGNQRE